ncbi:MAG: OB-fold nucleic acid binding domain-containing protein, partial [Burkholderiales bacterium]
LHPERSQMLASIPLAFEFAGSQLVHIQQSGLFDFDDSHASSTQEPPLVAADPWSIKERLMFEKAALGFYLSGHLFDQNAQEVRQFAKVKIADLTDSRELQILAGIVGHLRVINGQRGRVAIFNLDDRSDAIEAVVSEDLLQAHKEHLKDDELLIVQGKVQPDRFAGGLRLNVTALWDLASARCHFGKFLWLPVRGSDFPVAELIKEFLMPAGGQGEIGEFSKGLRLRLLIQRETASAELDLGEKGCIYPSEAALLRCAQLTEGQAKVVYSE